jgi:hypothetical protein
MNNKPQTDNEILVDMDEIDRLELECGISAAPSRKVKREDKPKYKPTGVASQRKINTK